MKKIENEELLLLAQLSELKEETFLDLEKAYNAKDKKRFDSAKQRILEAYKKMEFLLK